MSSFLRFPSGRSALSPFRRRNLIVAACLLLGLAAAFWRGPDWRPVPPPDPTEAARAPLEGTSPSSGSRAAPGERDEDSLKVSLVHPRAGGLRRRIVQTGSIEGLESADVFAKVSGYLRSIHVDIGARVEVGQLLAEIDVPELTQELERRKILLEQARGQAQQSRARLTVMQAEEETAAAGVSEAESRIERHAAERRFYQKETDRMRKLVREGVIEEQLLDEKQHQLEIAIAAEEHARRAVRVARAHWAEAGSRVELAQAEHGTAQAAIQAAAAELEHAKILLGYTRVVALLAGVVTKRNVHPGDFVRSAADGGREPLFRISRTDQMKVVVGAAERFVPYINPGDRAEVRVDALHGEVFEGTVARVSRFQDRKTRTMRVEIDVPNPEGRLIDGMYGSVTIIAPPPPDSYTVPTESLASGSDGGAGFLYVARSGRLAKVPVWIGQTEGGRAEVLSGLGEEDLVVSSVAGLPMGDGQLVDGGVRWDEEDILAGATDSGAALHEGFGEGE